MKDYNIYLNNRLTECDVIVYSLPYREGFTAINRLILETALYNYLLQKLIAVNSDMVLNSHIDKMIKYCFEKLNVDLNINSEADFIAQYTIHSDDLSIELSQSDISMLAVVFSSIQTALELGCSIDDCILKKSLRQFNSNVVLDSEISDTLKQSFNTMTSDVLLSTLDVTTLKTSCITISDIVNLNANIQALCYMLYINGSSSAEFDISLDDIEILRSLGSVDFNMDLSFGIDAQISTQTYENSELIAYLTQRILETIHYFIDISELQVFVDVESEIILRRYRLLDDMDEYTLADFDDIYFRDLDYIEL